MAKSRSNSTADLLAIPVPGHTRGHVVLLDRNKYLFTGDHLAWSERRGKGGGLIAFRMSRGTLGRNKPDPCGGLLDYRFEWVLPGHGRRVHLPADVMQRKLKDCVEWMSS